MSHLTGSSRHSTADHSRQCRTTVHSVWPTTTWQAHECAQGNTGNDYNTGNNYSTGNRAVQVKVSQCHWRGLECLECEWFLPSLDVRLSFRFIDCFVLSCNIPMALHIACQIIWYVDFLIRWMLCCKDVRKLVFFLSNRCLSVTEWTCCELLLMLRWWTCRRCRIVFLTAFHRWTQ